MREEKYYSAEVTDDFLNAPADAGELYLEKNGYHCTPTEAEIKKMAKQEYAMIFTQWIRANFQE